MEQGRERRHGGERGAGRLPRLAACGVVLASLAARTEAAYREPDIVKAVIEPAQLRIATNVQQYVAETLPACVCRFPDLRTDAQQVLYAKMLWVSLQLAPGNRYAIVVNAQLKYGQPLQIATPHNITPQRMSAVLLQAAQQCLAGNHPPDAVLAGYLLALSAEIDKTNTDALVALETYLAAGRKVDWSEVPGAGDKPLTTSASARPATPPTYQPIRLALVEEYASKPKALQKRQASVKSLMVQFLPDGRPMGAAIDAITTAASGAWSGEPSLRFVGMVGRDMQTAAQEAVRLVKQRYPRWQPSLVDASFGDKYTPKDGGSVGAAFALLLISMLDGVELEPGCAITGDVTVDGKIRPVSGVAAKVRGAATSGCSVVVVPATSEEDFADTLLLYPQDTIWRCQVFACETVEQALDVLRRDRRSDLQQSIEWFAAAQKQLLAGRGLPPQAWTTVRQVVEAAPNHLSAKYLLLLSGGQAPRTLSLQTSLDSVVLSVFPIRHLLRPEPPLEALLQPDAVYKGSVDSLMLLRGKVHPATTALHGNLLDFARTANKLHELAVSDVSVATKRGQIKPLDQQRVKQREAVMTSLKQMQGNQQILEQLMRQ
jgi:hypothetical protein